MSKIEPDGKDKYKLTLPTGGTIPYLDIDELVERLKEYEKKCKEAYDDAKKQREEYEKKAKP